MKKVITIFAVCVFSLFVLGMLNAFSIPYKDIVFYVYLGCDTVRRLLFFENGDKRRKKYSSFFENDAYTCSGIFSLPW